MILPIILAHLPSGLVSLPAGVPAAFFWIDAGAAMTAPPVLAWLNATGVGWVAGCLAVIALTFALALCRRARRQEGMELAWLCGLLDRVDSMTWEARVEKHGDDLHWRFRVPPSGLYRRIMGSTPVRDEMGLWWALEVVQQKEMDARSREALFSGASGYAQEFCVKREQAEFWLAERVSIEQQGADRWHLVGVITDVTLRRQMEEALRLKERQVQRILGEADCLVWRASVRDTGSEIEWSGFELPDSGLLRRIFGEKGRRGGADLWSLVDVPELPEMDARSSQAIRDGASGYAQEFRVLKPEGTLWLREQVAIHAAGPGHFSLVGVLIDVTAQREAEVARRESEAQVAQMLAGAECMLWQARVVEVGDRLDWNLFVPDSCLLREVFGDDPDAHRSLDWDSLVAPEARAAMDERSSRAIRSGADAYEQEIRAERKGRVFWLTERSSITRVADGEWRLVGVIVDNTARRVAEMALAAEKERLAVTLRAMADGVILADTLGHVLFINRAASELVEWDVEEATGHALGQVCQLVHESDNRPMSLPDARLASAATMTDLPPGTVLAGKNGGRRLVAGCSAAVRAADGSVVGSVHVLRDVTEHDRLQRELARASKLESVGILAGGIAHDFNNILTVILGNIHLALFDAANGSEQERTLREAEQGTLRARELTQQLLTFAKGGEPVRTAVRLPEVLHEVTRFALHGSRVRADFELADDLWLADADKGQIGQVIQNLVINAVQAMPHGGVVRLTGQNERVAAHRRGLGPGDYVHLVVADSGAGIQPEHLSRIFEPYFTTRPQGSGLGLATVYSIVRRHHGLVEVESTPGAGSSFHVWLPALPRGVAPVRAGSETVASVLRGAALFMDDEEPIRKLAGSVFSRLGLEVETARDGAEAIECFRRRREAGRSFDLVVVDLTVPGGMGGREAFLALRALDPAVKVIVSSGYSSDPILANYRALGFAGMIAKPYDLVEFARVVREVMESEPPGTAGV